MQKINVTLYKGGRKKMKEIYVWILENKAQLISRLL